MARGAALRGHRVGELAGLQVGDRIEVPGPGLRLRLRRAVLSSGGGGEQFIDTLKTSSARTVPIVADVLPIIDRWCESKQMSDRIFAAPRGGTLWERNWQRSVNWRKAVTQIGHPHLRVHDLRHTAASLWPPSGADPKVVQRILGHTSAAMTMDLYGHLIDQNLWDAAKQLGPSGGISGASGGTSPVSDAPNDGDKVPPTRGDA